VQEKKMQAEIVVVGTGAGGGTVARELALRGKDVVMLEKGSWNRWLGNLLSMLRILDRMAVFSRSREGVIIDRAITVGGSTVMYAGNSFDPPGWLKEEYGIDITGLAAETKSELKVAPLPEDWYGPGTVRLRQVAAEMGINLLPQEKFVDPAKCDATCDHCMMGCERDAKWTTRSYVNEALERGARLVTRADVREVIFAGNRREAVGVKAATPEGELLVEAGKVVLSAGGMGTPVILNRSGIWEAGDNFFMDPMAVVLGIARKGEGTWGETTFTHASTDFLESDGFIIGITGGMNALLSMLTRPTTAWNAYKFLRYPGAMGMFAKIADSSSGFINLDGSMSKPMTREDQLMMSKGAAICEKIMIRAGADPRSISMVKELGGHPGGTAAIGKVVDSDLRTEVENLYVCDGSVLPRSPGRPPVLTILSLAKRLAASL